MEDLTILRDLVVLVAIAIPVVALAHRFKIPSVVGFLATGVLIGPHALGLIHEVESVHRLAELGVVLLLFAIGLELSLARIVRMGPLILRGGLIQVIGTMFVTVVVAVAFDIDTPTAVTLGALAALSSTAIVLKVYKDRGALDSPDGRVIVGILVFQDLAIVPLVLLLQLMGRSGEALGAAVGSVAVSLLVITVMVVGGRFAVPWILARLVDLRNREIFTLSIMFFGLSAAFLTASVGLSLALGAFLAGLVISESEFGFQALSDVLPFRDTFSGIFFTSVGMLLEIGYVTDNLAVVVLVTIGIITIKALVATGATLALGRTLQVSLTTGIALAQVGEFSFVLASVALPLGLLTPSLNQLFLGAAVLSMLLTPFAIAAARPLATSVARALHRRTESISALDANEAKGLSDHVIIIGYGVNGRNLARVLDGAGIEYVVLEQNGQVVRRGRADLQPIVFGDATQTHVLEKVGVARARVIVLAISSPSDEHRAVAIARTLNPAIRIVVRTRYVQAIAQLKGVGADEVIAEEFETSLEIFSRVLQHYNIPSNVIDREVGAAREEHYGIILGKTTGEYQLDALAHLGIHRAIEIVEAETGARAIGEHPVSLQLRRETGATVVAVVRAGEPFYAPDPDLRFMAGDSVVLVGDEDALAKAKRLFVAGK